MTYLWSFLAFFVTFAAWSIANPLTAAPDEPAHITKAAAVVHGQLVGTMYDPEHPGWGTVEVPAVTGFTTQMPSCFAFKADVTAACMPTFHGDPAATVQAVSTASTYNPLYYAVVGLPSLAPTGSTIYLMRLVSAALCAAAMAWAMTQALSGRRPDWVALGTVLALTPMVVYMAGVVNPASLEMAGAVALWVSMGVLVRDEQLHLRHSRLVAICVIAAFFVNLRGLSPLFLAMIVAGTVLSAPLSRTLPIVREKRSWPWFGLVALAGLGALIWTKTAGTLDSDGVIHHPTLTFWTAVQWSLGDTSVYVANQMGQFGWVDTNLPTWILMTIAATIGILLVLAVALGDRRERLVLIALAVAVVVIPVVIHASQAKYLGIVWQGRYFLPAAVGLPILSGLVLARVFGTSERHLAWRATVVLGSTWLLYQVVAFTLNLHRYQNGASYGWRNGPVDQWHPPLPVPLLFALLLCGLLGTLALCLRSTERAVDDDHPDVQRAASTPPSGLVAPHLGAPTRGSDDADG